MGVDGNIGYGIYVEQTVLGVSITCKMPHQHPADICFKTVIACLGPALDLMDEINDALGTPFVEAISNTIKFLITTIEVIYSIEFDSIWSEMDSRMSNITKMNVSGLWSMFLNCNCRDLHIKSETLGNLPPATLEHVGEFMK